MVTILISVAHTDSNCHLHKHNANAMDGLYRSPNYKCYSALPSAYISED